MKLIVIVLYVTASACLQIAAATICKPDSTFRMDCNTCICSATGREYACTEKHCPPIQYKEKYLFETNKDGHVILKPRNNNKLTDNEFGLANRNTRKTEDRLVPAAYVKDDISGEDDFKDTDDFNYYESEDDDYDENEYNGLEQNYFGTDSDETIRDDNENLNYWDKLLKKRD